METQVQWHTPNRKSGADYLNPRPQICGLWGRCAPRNPMHRTQCATGYAVSYTRRAAKARRRPVASAASHPTAEDAAGRCGAWGRSQPPPSAGCERSENPKRSGCCSGSARRFRQGGSHWWGGSVFHLIPHRPPISEQIKRAARHLPGFALS